MQSHEHAMSDAVRSHESTLSLLFDATAGLQSSDLLVVCRHCDQPIHADSHGAWEHDATGSDTCTDDENSPDAAPTDEMTSMLESVGVDVDDVNDSSESAIDNYALSVETRTVLDVELTIGGPTVRMSAPIERGQYGTWERVGTVEFTDSWAVPNETRLHDDSMLVALFDRYVESYDGGQS